MLGPMPTLDSTLAGLRFADLMTFVTVVRSRSISGAARQLRVTPSQVSKAVTRLEHQLGVRLLSRGTRGASVTEAGRRIAPRAADVVAHAQALRASDERPDNALTFAAPEFLNSALLPRIATRIAPSRVRSIELPPGLESAYATQSIFDAAFTHGSERWPETWSLSYMGAIRRGLFCAPGRAVQLGRQPIDPASLRSAPFITPIYSYRGQLVAGDDGCPLPPAERKIGGETEAVSLALELARRSDQLVFAPALAARPWVERGQLVELKVETWDVVEPLYLACHAE